MVTASLERRLWWAGIAIALGLVVQLTTSLWVHPLAFVAFLVVTCPLVAVGMLVYFYAIVRAT